ncbi:hypothetical protein Dda_0218 [Drechslerella dactyloides]|uniref:Uncharacterized protein n=1 Tax=Drechslerella dactyloides TaxID=74499 RepID=A0AAD6J5D0_DREDA|nr:hypothetical protein Dda_0218 [Drechslerella dactyloides]
MLIEEAPRSPEKLHSRLWKSKTLAENEGINLVVGFGLCQDERGQYDRCPEQRGRGRHALFMVLEVDQKMY